MVIELIEVIQAQSHYDFLYELLRKRPKKHNISHKEMPTLKEHEAFVQRRPYHSWWIININGEDIGSVYITRRLCEIGIHLLEENDEIKGIVVDCIKRRFPKMRLLANVAIDNIEGQKFWESQGFKKLQVTYELDS